MGKPETRVLKKEQGHNHRSSRMTISGETTPKNKNKAKKRWKIYEREEAKQVDMIQKKIFKKIQLMTGLKKNNNPGTRNEMI